MKYKIIDETTKYLGYSSVEEWKQMHKNKN